ncbi:MAG TPA: 2-amino-4-hydroxy-6-hydroxymethyldihydropteridine diphosphokinase [Campylobacterales bacterium]|nr:2-amino-4-hydroxy-6-hydroxymethyldihydropteridine diphosphokinase [Campylobacterales bacterium]HHH51741.1 2-amino-4-hydroxy-6-hydroxymethyldihydropteridine diphosphokinase [Campylobacterales bacterium]
MVRVLDKKNSLYIQNLYPYQRKSTAINHKYNALLGIGGNIGDVRRRFNHLFIYLKKSPYVSIIETTPIIKNPPFGYLEQDYFYNSLIYIKTSLKPKALLKYILHIEKKFSRKRSFQDAPRTLDIDMIFYEDLYMHSKELTLPHPSWQERDSVLIPMSYIKSNCFKTLKHYKQDYLYSLSHLKR